MGCISFWSHSNYLQDLDENSIQAKCNVLRSRQAQLEKLGSDGVYKVVIGNTTGVNWKPGQHCYLRFAGVRILDNHPFQLHPLMKKIKLP